MINSSKPDNTPWSQIEAGPAARQVTPAIIPPADERNPIGYTIGNEMEYASIAMDHEPGDDGNYRGERPRATAERDWFDKYMLNGEATRTVAAATKKGMGLAGFNR